MQFLRGLASQVEVVHAIVLRETRTRFGAQRLGYLWALLEPTIVILTFYAVFRINHRSAPEGMDLFSFIATGVIPYTLFGNSVSRVAEAINGNKSLLYYPQVRPIDLVLARCALEAATFAAVFMLLLGGHTLWVQHLEIDSPLLVITGMAMASLLGTSLGMIFCALGQVSAAVDRARGPIVRPLFWISGVYFTVGMLPEAAQKPMLKNPLLHAIELVRAGWFPSYDARYVDVGYVSAWIGVLMLAGLLLERAVRRRIEMT
jgi:capsular polysaccharide transport system permease protein